METAEVTIREAQVADVEGILDALEPVAAEDRWIATEAPIARSRVRPFFAARIGVPDGTIFVAVDDTRIVGSLGVRRGFGGCAEIGMSLLAEYRGRGIGSQLMERAIGWARDRDHHKISLQVHPWNEAALSLYEKFGFAREGYFRKHFRRRNGELWDVIQMGLLLTMPDQHLVLLLYSVVEDYVERRTAYRPEHLAHVGAARDRGEVLLAGAYGEPVAGAALVFTNEDAARRFAETDPYVINGLVTAWQVHRWHNVIDAPARLV